MKHSLSRQLAVIFIGVMVLTTGLSLLVNQVCLERFYMASKEKTLVRAYEILDQSVEDGQLNTEVDTLEDELLSVTASSSISLVVVDTSGNVILGTSNNDIRVMTGRLFGYVYGLDDEADVLSSTDSYTLQQRYDEVTTLTYLEMWGQLSGDASFMMRIPMESIHTSVLIFRRFSLYFSILQIILGVILIHFLSRRVTRPVRELTELSKRMANLDFDARYTSGGSDEIGQLGAHFNQMSETLEQTISQLKSANAELQRDVERKTKIDSMRREFLANVSHELKTPLAVIQGYAEGLQECVNDDEESRNYYCDVIISEAGKMNSLVRKLLTLNQLEFGEDKVEMVRFDLAALIRGKLSAMQILGQSKDADMTCEGPEQVWAWGDEFKVEEVLTNYLSNALNHLDGERKVRVRVSEADGKVHTSVFNTGQPIPEESLDQVWDKFYKVDKARTRAYGGSGVGLSIVRAIMESFGQKYGVLNHEDGVEFWFELDDAGPEHTEDQEDAHEQ